MGLDNVAKYVEAGELIPLLCALAEISGDTSLIDDAFLPRLQAEMITVSANGGMPPEAAQKARDRAATVLAGLIRGGRLGGPSDIPTSALIDFMSGGAKDHAELLRHQLGTPSPALWKKADIAPGRAFRVGIIGAGQSGLAMARGLKRAGVDFVLYERSDGVGGVWWANTYPGCRLDTGRLAYSYSFAQRTDWRHHFSKQSELLGYYEAFAAEHALIDRIEFSSQVVRAQFDDAQSRWRLTVRDVASGAERISEVDAVISAVGVLNEPKRPSFKDDERFGGQTVHSAQWHAGIDYRGKRVSIIGTGASAYQIAPSIAGDVASLAIFQRSAPWMLPTPQYHDEVSAEARWLSDNLPNYHRWLRLWEFWHSTIGKYALTKADPNWRQPGSVSQANQRFRADLVARIRTQYPGRDELADAVIPPYPVGAKRMLRDNGVWARTLKSPHVSLVTDEISRFDEEGIVTKKGDRFPSDLIIYATGFHATDFLRTLTVEGRHGLRLSDYWGDEARAYLGISIPGFPNFFCIGGPNTGLVAIGSQTFMHECAIHYVGQCIRALLEKGAPTMAPTENAYRAFADWVEEGNRKMAWGAAEVNSWYRNSRGVVTASWPFPLLTYWQITREVDPEKVVFDEVPAAAMNQ